MKLSISLFLASLLASTTAAAPGNTKRFARGWCTFHLKENRSDNKSMFEAVRQDTRVYMEVMDDKGKTLYTYPLKNIRDDLEEYGSYTIKPKGFEHGMRLEELKKDTTDGWKFTFTGPNGEESWKTTDNGRCNDSNGPHGPNAGSGGRLTREYDCGFTC